MNLPPYENWITSFNPNFPTTLTDASSYLEQLERCYRKVYDTLVYVKSLKDELQILAENASELKFNSLKKEINENFQRLQLQQIESEKKILDLLQQNVSSLKDLIEDTNDFTLSLISSTSDLINEKLRNLKISLETDIESLEEEYQNLLSTFNKNQNEILEEISSLKAEIPSLKEGILSLYSEFNLFKQHVNNNFDTLSNTLIQKLEEQIARIQGDLIIVTNPLTGQPDQLRDVLSGISQWKTPFPIKFETFNSLQIKFEEFNEMNIRVIDFNNFAGLIFWKDLNYPPFQQQIENLKAELDTLKNPLWWDYLNGNHETPFQAYKTLATYVIDNIGTPISYENFNSRNFEFQQFNALNMPIEEFNINFRAWIQAHSTL